MTQQLAEHDPRVRSAALARGFFDDAAIFPPGDMSMTAAVPHHRGLRAQYPDLVGPFVVGEARLSELIDELVDGEPLEISLIVQAATAAAALATVAQQPGLRLVGIEVAGGSDLAVLQWIRRLTPDVPRWVELPYRGESAAIARELLPVLDGIGWRAKLRTGGLAPDLFPTEAELAAVLSGCVQHSVAFKCTAGLHHALRHTARDTGFEHHGFLNILLAVDALLGGAEVEAGRRLGERDAGTVTAELGTWSVPRLRDARRLFRSFGTCSVEEPIADLIDLGLLPALTPPASAAPEPTTPKWIRS